MPQVKGSACRLMQQGSGADAVVTIRAGWGSEQQALECVGGV